jgi:hypothetical protein
VTNRNAAALHRRLDTASAEALARDGGELVEHTAPLLPPGGRRADVGTLGWSAQPKVLLLRLSECTSARGTKYLTGWLGHASVVAFEAREPDKFGRRAWDVFVSTPMPKGGSDT